MLDCANVHGPRYARAIPALALLIGETAVMEHHHPCSPPAPRSLLDGLLMPVHARCSRPGANQARCPRHRILQAKHLQARSRGRLENMSVCSTISKCPTHNRRTCRPTEQANDRGVGQRDADRVSFVEAVTCNAATHPALEVRIIASGVADTIAPRTGFESNCHR